MDKVLSTDQLLSPNRPKGVFVEDVVPPASFTWLPLPDLPHPPEHFIQRAYELQEKGRQGLLEDVILKSGYITKEHRNRDIVKNGRVQKAQHQVGFSMGEDWEQWVRENITDNFYDTSVRTTGSPDPDNATELGPHTDGTRLRLFYLIERGSDETSTSFYVKPGWPMVVDHRAVQKDNTKSPHVDNVDTDVVEIDRAFFPIRQWVLLNSWVLHGVNNIPGVFKRLNFQIAIPSNSITHQVKFKKLNN